MKNHFLVPVSIVIAGIIIAGALIYNPSERPAADTRGAEKSLYEELATNLGLDMEKFNACVKERTYKDEVEKDYADALAFGVDATPTTFINGVKIRGAASYGAYKAVIEAALNNEIDPSDITEGVNSDDDAVLGDPSAPVTMIVFGDYQCPFCLQAFETSEKQAREEYVSSGKVKMVYRDFPLSNIHRAAKPAAEAAECAKEQEKYWQYHDALFENQDRL